MKKCPIIDYMEKNHLSNNYGILTKPIASVDDLQRHDEDYIELCVENGSAGTAVKFLENIYHIDSEEAMDYVQQVVKEVKKREE